MDKRREIEKLAYELYERSGYVCGNDLDHWLEAERIICSRIAAGDAKVSKTTSSRRSCLTASSAKKEPKLSGEAKKRVSTRSGEPASGRRKKASD